MSNPRRPVLDVLQAHRYSVLALACSRRPCEITWVSGVHGLP